jgi:hypothetical protein
VEYFLVDGYGGSNDLLDKLEYACQERSAVDLYWGELMELLRESRDEIRRLRQLVSNGSGTG